MLWHILKAFGGKLPPDVVVTFFNTGKEREETLVFVRECGRRWGVPIVWLEYHNYPNGNELSHTFKVVNFDSASRLGEPFELLINSRRYLPNRVARFCTAELKVRTGKRYLMSIGFEHWTCAVGIRADEPRRLTLKADSRERWERVHPLADAGVCVDDVMAFWAAQDFDLGIRQDQGNCDLCFLKGRAKLARLVTENPAVADWWIAQEDRMKSLGESLGQFSPRFSYRDLVNNSQGGPMFCGLEVEQEEDCNCTD